MNLELNLTPDTVHENKALITKTITKKSEFSYRFATHFKQNINRNKNNYKTN